MSGWLIPIVLGALVACAVLVAASIFSNKITLNISSLLHSRLLPIFAIVCCAAGIYAIYPYYTLWRISSALQTRDAELLSSFIDWPALRESLQGELKARAAANSFASDSNQNAFGLLGTAIGLTLIDNMINSLVSPEMLRAWAKSNRKPLSNPPAQSAGRALDTLSAPDTTLMSRVSYAFFTSPSEFQIDISDPKKQSTLTAFLSFSSLSWKLTRLVLPEDKSDAAKLNDRTASTAGSESTSKAHVDIGFGLTRKGEYGPALLEFDRAIELDPTSSQAYMGRGDVYRLRGDYERALADVNEAIRLDPKNASALSIRGGIYSIKGDNDTALANTNAAITLKPNESMLYNNRGFVYNNKRDYNRAIADLNEAIRLNSKNAFAYKNRGISYEKKNQLHDALNDYASAVQLNPKLQEAVDGMWRVGQLLANSGSQQLESRQTSDPPASVPRVAGSDLYIDLGQYIGRPVVLTDGRVFGANNLGALITAGGTTFKMTVEGIDRESFRFFLKNCSGIIGDQCKVPLLVTATGEKFSGWPLVRDVKIAH